MSLGNARRSNAIVSKNLRRLRHVCLMDFSSLGPTRLLRESCTALASCKALGNELISFLHMRTRANECLLIVHSYRSVVYTLQERCAHPATTAAASKTRAETCKVAVCRVAVRRSCPRAAARDRIYIEKKY